MLSLAGILLPSAACAPLAAAVLVHGGVQAVRKLEEKAALKRANRARLIIENSGAPMLDWPTENGENQ